MRNDGTAMVNVRINLLQAAKKFPGGAKPGLEKNSFFLGGGEF